MACMNFFLPHRSPKTIWMTAPTASPAIYDDTIAPVIAAFGLPIAARRPSQLSWWVEHSNGSPCLNEAWAMDVVTIPLEAGREREPGPELKLATTTRRDPRIKPKGEGPKGCKGACVGCVGNHDLHKSVSDGSGGGGGVRGPPSRSLRNDEWGGRTHCWFGARDLARGSTGSRKMQWR